MTNSELAEQIPPLKPPRGEIPPGFWEQHGIWVIVGALVLFYLVAWLIWLLCRKGKQDSIPPEAEAHAALSKLRGQPEDGRTISEISRIVRTYFLRAFNLAPGEHTTAELAAMARQSKSTGTELADKLSVFLSECDRRKFAPTTQAAGAWALDEADALIESGEMRRQQLRIAEAEAASQQNARQS